MFPPRLKDPYVLIAAAVSVLALAFGIYYYASSTPREWSPDELAEMAQTEDGRREIADSLRIRPEVWSALVELVNAQPTHQLKATMEESGITYDVTAMVAGKDTGPVELLIQSRNDADLKITMIDADRDQSPEMLTITKTANGKVETHETPIEKYSSEDASQFLLAWALAWGTIAEEHRAAVAPAEASE